MRCEKFYTSSSSHQERLSQGRFATSIKISPEIELQAEITRETLYRGDIDGLTLMEFGSKVRQEMIKSANNKQEEKRCY